MTTGPIVDLPPDCLPQLELLLTQNGLPADDCAEQVDSFFGIFDDDRLVAAGGLETAGGYGLLRSLVVHPDYRENGLAHGLCEYLLRRAGEQRLRAVYLLTESASAYFEKFGFIRCSREEAPTAIQATRQFAALCPDSAACLVFDLPKSA